MLAVRLTGVRSLELQRVLRTATGQMQGWTKTLKGITYIACFFRGN